MLWRWEQEINQSGEKAFPGKGSPKDEEMAALKKENQSLKEEVEILKRQWESGPQPELDLGSGLSPSLRYQFNKDHRGQFSVEAMCRVLQVSPSGYYNWCRNPTSLHQKENQQLVEEIKKVYKQSHQTGPRCTGSVGRSMQPTLAKKLAIAALQMALRFCQPTAGLLHHSDRDSQYGSNDYMTISKCLMPIRSAVR